MNPLADRIAEVLRAHCPGTYEEGHCDCGFPANDDPEWAAHVAERIATKLMSPEHLSEWGQGYRSGVIEGLCRAKHAVEAHIPPVSEWEPER